jgi:hypothetical protein
MLHRLLRFAESRGWGFERLAGAWAHSLNIRWLEPSQPRPEYACRTG